jgi:hypothetical protein
VRKKRWILYDARAHGGNTEEAQVHCTASSLKEAKRDKREMFPDAAIYEYDVQGDELVNETYVG